MTRRTRHTFGTLRIPRGAGITDSGVVDGGVSEGEALARLTAIRRASMVRWGIADECDAATTRGSEGGVPGEGERGG